MKNESKDKVNSWYSHRRTFNWIVNVPIYQTSTYKQEAVGKHQGYEYSRTGNNTTLEEMIVGMLDLHLVQEWRYYSDNMLFSKGDHVILTDDVYGGTYRVITKVLNRFGIEHTFVDTTNLEEVEEAIRPNTKAIYVETPTNPLLKLLILRNIYSC